MRPLRRRIMCFLNSLLVSKPSSAGTGVACFLLVAEEKASPTVKQSAWEFVYIRINSPPFPQKTDAVIIEKDTPSRRITIFFLSPPSLRGIKSLVFRWVNPLRISLILQGHKSSAVAESGGNMACCASTERRENAVDYTVVGERWLR